MTEYADWRGRPVQVTAETIEAVLAGHGRRHRRPGAGAAAEGARAVAADAAADRGGGGGPDGLGAGARDRRRPASRCGSSSRTAAPAGPTRSTTGSSPARSTGSRIGEATFAVPTDLPLGYHPLKARSGDTEAQRPPDRVARLARPPRAGRPEAPVGVRDPALQRPLRRQLGARRPHRPHRPRRLVGQRAGRRLRPGQPAARRRAAGAVGALAVPAQLAQVLQPDLPARRADPRVRRAAPARAGRGRPAGRRSCRPG